MDADDTTAANAAVGKAIYQSQYNVDADFNRDGAVNSTDTAQVTSASYKAVLSPGLSAASGSLHFGGPAYCGYMYNAEPGGAAAWVCTPCASATSIRSGDDGWNVIW